MRALLILGLVLAGCLEAPIDSKPDPAADPSNFEGARWTSHASSPTPRTEAASAEMGGKIWMIGGYVVSAVPTNLVEVYDPAADRWSRGPDYPIPVHHAHVAVVGNALFVLGGYTTSGFVPTNVAFKLEGPNWTPLAPLPAPRGAGVAVSLDGRIYLVGGVGLDQKLLAATHVYDVANDTWGEAAPLPTPRDHLGGATIGGKIYAVGGRALTLSTNTGALEVFDPAANSWSSLEAMPTPRGGIGVAAWRGALVVAGGEEPSGTFPDVEAYDPQNATWKELPDLPTPRHGVSAATVGERFYVLLGGPEPAFTVSDVAESLGE